jgi:hypothetical protein
MKRFLRKILKEQEENQYYKMTPQEYLNLMELSGYHEGATKLKKFGGRPIWITGDLDVSHTPIESLGNVGKIDGRLNISYTKIKDVSGIEIMGYINDYKTPRESFRIAKELREKRLKAQERRENNEWDLENTDDEGLKANAFYEWLVYTGEIETIDDDEREDLENLKMISERLTIDYNECVEDCDDLYDDLSEVDTRIEELENKLNDVYVISPLNYSNYGMNMFEVLLDGFKDKTYSVGTEEEIENAALKYAKDTIDDLGVSGFNKGFVESNLDEDSLREFIRDWYEDDVWQNPEIYFKDEDFELTEEQEIRISELENYIENLEDYISKMEDKQTELDDEIEDPEEYSQRYDEIQKMIDDAEEKKDSAQEELDSIEPDREPTHDMVDDVVERIVNRHMRNPLSFIEEHQLDIRNFVDEEEMAKDMVRQDGYGILSRYNNDYDTIILNDVYYYLMRIE